MSEPDPARFGGPVPPAIDELLVRAAATYHQSQEAERLLLEAQGRDPECLPVYFALYKFYFYKHRLEEAEATVLEGLAMAARLGGFPFEHRRLSPQSAAFAAVESPAHFYLFSLKALAFIRLRLKRFPECEEILDKLQELDPQDTVGHSVIRAFAEGSTQ